MATTTSPPSKLLFGAQPSAFFLRCQMSPQVPPARKATPQRKHSWILRTERQVSLWPLKADSYVTRSTGSMVSFLATLISSAFLFRMEQTGSSPLPFLWCFKNAPQVTNGHLLTPGSHRRCGISVATKWTPHSTKIGLLLIALQDLLANPPFPEKIIR